jgi:DNA polymerase-3 subunit delta
MPGLKPAYLICGDDDAKIDAWRARVRRRAEDENGPGALETFTAPADPPEAVATALTTLTFASGDRYLLADGVEAWKAGDLDPLERELAAMPEGTVLVLVARGKPPARLVKAVDKAGGEHREYSAPKPWQMPKWVVERAREEGLNLDQEAAKALVAVVGVRQQRLVREIERLAILAHPRTQLSADEVTRLAAGDAVQQVYDLADALVAGDVAATLRFAERLTGAGDPPSKLAYPIVRRLRDVHRAAELLDAGVPEAKVAAAMKMPPWAAKRTLAQAKKADREALARALCLFADLEVEVRGGGAGLDEDTAFSLTLARAAA